MDGLETDIVKLNTTRRARRILRLIAALTGNDMQSEAERVFVAELERLGGKELPPRPLSEEHER